MLAALFQCRLDAIFGVECRPGCRDMPLYAAICRSLERKSSICLRWLFATFDLDQLFQARSNRQVLKQLADTLTEFQVAFEIIPRTVTKAVAKEELNDFEVGPIVTAHE